MSAGSLMFEDIGNAGWFCVLEVHEADSWMERLFYCFILLCREELAAVESAGRSSTLAQTSKAGNRTTSLKSGHDWPVCWKSCNLYSFTDCNEVFMLKNLIIKRKARI